MTLPYVMRSGTHGSSPRASASSCSTPHQPRGPARNPVSTSSRMNTAPSLRASDAMSALKPSGGRTTPMLAGAASVITAAMVWPCSAKAAVSASASP